VEARHHHRDFCWHVTPMTPVVARLVPRELEVPAPSVPAGGELAAELERAAKGLRGARARTGLNEEEVVSILGRQGVALTVAGLRRAESTGAIGLALAARLADIYGTTTDGLAGRRLHRTRPSLDDCGTHS
jgi:hypothetical protein